MKHTHSEIYEQVMKTEGIDQIQYVPFFDIAVQFGISIARSRGLDAEPTVQMAIEETLRLLRMEDRLETVISGNLKIVEYNENE